MQNKATKHDDASIMTAEHPLATTSEHPLVANAAIADNDKEWSLMYKAIVDGIGASPSNFQLVYPFTTWDWPVVPVGYTSAAEWDFVSGVPQWSATGRYDSSGTAFNDGYGMLLTIIPAATEDPALRTEIDQARNQYNLAANNYDIIYKQSQDAYRTETGISNVPSYTEWLGTPGGKSWQSRLSAAEVEVNASYEVYTSLVAQSQTPGLKEAQGRYSNKDYYTKYQNPSLATFPAVPGYATTMSATEWLTRAKAGTAGSKGSISFSNAQSAYDYKNTWAGGSASVGNLFWAVKVGGSWQEIKEFSSDSALEVLVSFQAWDQIGISAGRWYNGAFVNAIKNGPFVKGFSAYGGDGTTAVWGQNGVMSAQKVGMIVCYKPSFIIKASQSSFNSFYESWKVSTSVRIGPFEFSGGGGSTTAGWKADSATRTFTGTSTAETALIMGVNINLINPK